jgi:hypothetical protein
MPADRPKPPHPGDLIRTIRSLAARGKVSFTDHALEERMPERGIGLGDVRQVLLRGDIEGRIAPGRKAGEWRCLVVGRLDWTPREAGVATVVVRHDRLVVLTVEWMDP